MQTKWKRRLSSLASTYRWVDLDNGRGDKRLWRGRFDVCDAFALGFVGAIALVLLARSDALQPFISDTWYHLAIAKQIRLRGELPSWVDWDYAPVGRPHLYPPFLHVILAGLASATGSVLTAGKILAVTFLPASLFTCWWAARWIFDSRTALVATLLLSLDVSHAVVQLIYIPSCIVNILSPVLIVTVLTRRTWPSIVLLTFMLYAHIAIPYLVVLGLVLFALKYPRYRNEVLKVVGVSLVWVSPWVLRTVMEREWIAGAVASGGLPMGMLKRLMSLQMFNGVLIGCGLWGLFRLRRWRVQEAIVRWMLLGMVPLLFSYGGRFTMHSAPWWALSAATVVTRLLPQATWRRAAALTAATLLPYPGLLPLTTTHAVVILAATGKPMMGGNKDKSEAYLPDCDRAIRWIEAHTAPGDVVFTNKEWLGDMIPLLSDRRSDFGCWWECSREIGKLQNRYYRDDGRRAVFLCIRPETDVGSILGPTPKMPAVDQYFDIGRLRVGLRYQRVFTNPRPLDHFDSPDTTWWKRHEASAPCSLRVVRGDLDRPGGRAHRYLSWRVPPGQGHARVVRPVRVANADGIAMNVRASAPLGGAKLGLQHTDGSAFEYELSLPCIAQPISPEEIERALWVRVRVTFDHMTPSGKLADETTKVNRAKVAWLYLDCPQDRQREIRIDLDDIELMDVQVVREEAAVP